MTEPTGSRTEGSDNAPAHRYTAALAGAIERRWQDYWDEHGTYHAPNPTGPLAEGGPSISAEESLAGSSISAEEPLAGSSISTEEPLAGSSISTDKLFVQDMFPYPSGAGLHVGHPLGYIGTDTFARFHRMLGRNVLHTLGFDAFGLPAEQYAVQTGTHPRVTTEANIANMTRQLRQLGLGHDQRRSFATTDPDYYRWTQWIFLQIYNSFYDEKQNKARPIVELEAEYAQDKRRTPSGRGWCELTRAEQLAVLDTHRLAYVTESPVNWCPGLGTVLSNEEVTSEGRSERGNFPVFRRNLRQWMMRITAYADRLVDDLDRLDWPEKVKSMQRNWIGRSHGARVRFPIPAGAAGSSIEVFTTRPDTLFGATYMVLAPEHPLVEQLTGDSWPDGVDQRWTGGAATPGEAVAGYRRAASMKSELDRQENKEKTGVFTGFFATNPVSGASIPVFVADYVLMGYGTGAIMAVPGHDTRDWDFATTFGLPIVEVVSGGDVTEAAYVGDGVAVNSANDEGLSLNGLGVDDAKKTITAWLEEHGHGTGAVQYKLRDWLFSRQRYWGEPFPIVYDTDGVAHALPEHMLPVELPEVEDYSPTTYDPEAADTEPSPPLAKAAEWVEVELDLGNGRQRYRRETNTMPNWAGSCWYQLRYIDPTNDERLCDPENERYWMGPRPELHGPNDPGGIDLYVGGVEHAVLHLLYARFWHKVLFDLGHVSSAEPYRRLYNQGYIQAFAYTDARGVYVPAEDVVEENGKFFYNGAEVTQEYGKMGKSLRNVVTPDQMAEDYGVDTFRFYEMSMGPLDVSRPWATKDVIGAQRFLQRLWRLVVDESTGTLRVADAELSEDDLRALNKTVAGVREDYAELRFNTAGAKLIELNNYVTKHYGGSAATPRALAEPLVLMLAPLCPHIAEELWSRLGHGESLVHGPFPVADERYLVDDTVEYPIQVNGKVRSRVTVAADADRAAVQAAALADEKIAALTGGAEPRKVIVVPGRLVNIVL